MGAAIHNRVHNNLDPWHGRNHLVNESCNNHDNPQNRSLDSNRQNPGSCAPSRLEQKYKFKHANTGVEVEHA